MKKVEIQLVLCEYTIKVHSNSLTLSNLTTSGCFFLVMSRLITALNDKNDSL